MVPELISLKMLMLLDRLYPYFEQVTSNREEKNFPKATAALETLEAAETAVAAVRAASCF